MKKRMYGHWYPAEENKTRCVEEVWDEVSREPHQCCRKRGYGPGELYCKQHAAKKAKETKDA